MARTVAFSAGRRSVEKGTALLDPRVNLRGMSGLVPVLCLLVLL